MLADWSIRAPRETPGGPLNFLAIEYFNNWHSEHRDFVLRRFRLAPRWRKTRFEPSVRRDTSNFSKTASCRLWLIFRQPESRRERPECRSSSTVLKVRKPSVPRRVVRCGGAQSISPSHGWKYAAQPPPVRSFRINVASSASAGASGAAEELLN